MSHPPVPAELDRLLAECKDQPDDDAPRLVLADWVEEHARGPADLARGELIRLQCRVAYVDFHGPEAPPLRERVKELIEEFGPTWSGPLWSGHWPQRGLCVVGYPVPGDPAPLEALLGSEFWAWTGELHPWQVRNTGQLAGVLASPCLKAVRSLNLEGNRIGPAGAVLLASSPAVAHLRILNLAFSENVGDDGAAALAASPPLAGLRHLHLTRSGITARGAAALAASPHLAGLTRLFLGANAVGAKGMEALAASPHLQRLITLDLYSNSTIGKKGMRALAGSPLLAGLKRLSLSRCGLDDEAVAALAASPYLAAEDIDLFHNQIGDVGLEALAASPRLAGVRKLNLCFNPIGNRGAQALAASPHLTNLRVLDLSNCRIGAPGGRVLAESPLLGRLYRLDLSNNAIGTRAGEALAASPHLAGLYKLGVVACKIGGPARKVLETRLRADALRLSDS